MSTSFWRDLLISISIGFGLALVIAIGIVSFVLIAASKMHSI